MRLALFDIDETLIRCDSEFRWCRFLTSNGLYDMSDIDRFSDDYHAGELDFAAFSRFQLAPLVSLGQADLDSILQRFLTEEIGPEICDLLQSRVARHRAAGDTLLVVSAAHDFLAAPIARLAGIDDGLYTTAAHNGVGYTGGIVGEPCFQAGKIAHVTTWLGERGLTWSDLEDSWFYSDSHNDLPLLQLVTHPIAVRPDPTLRRVAERDAWEVIE